VYTVPDRGVARSKNLGWTTGRHSKGGLEAEPAAGPGSSGQSVKLPEAEKKLIESASVSGTPSGKSGVSK